MHDSAGESWRKDSQILVVQKVDRNPFASCENMKIRFSVGTVKDVQFIDLTVLKLFKSVTICFQLRCYLSSSVIPLGDMAGGFFQTLDGCGLG